MAKFEKIENTKGQYQFYCKGCDMFHDVWTENEGYEHPIWDFNQDIDKPTISPSIFVYTYTNQKCHSFIKNGMIQYLNDCTHELKNQTIELPDITEDNF